MLQGKILQYDGSWHGLFTLIFQVYAHRWQVRTILAKRGEVQAQLFADIEEVLTDEVLANRVLKGLREKFNKELIQELYYVFLSELPESELLILQAVQFYFSRSSDSQYLSKDKKLRHNYGVDIILRIQQIGRSVSRERHRMKAFIRFEKMKDGLYVAFIEPDFNVLPLILKHFKDRYTDQAWLIYDLKRQFGAYYDLDKVEEITLDHSNQEQANRAINWDEDEALYIDLWQRYFRSVNIKERKNTKLHIQEVPRRYWKYLTEKK